METYKHRLIRTLEDPGTSQERKKLLEEMFPELVRETLDKRITESIRKCLDYCLRNDDAVIDTETHRECVKWLEDMCMKNRQEAVPTVPAMKYHEGEWIYRYGNSPLLINAVISETSTYVTADQDGNTLTFDISEVDNSSRRWTFSDAKDGDILSYDRGRWVLIFRSAHDNIIEYHALLSDNGFTLNESAICVLNSAIRPATHEECMRLLLRLNADGHPWNPEKKKLFCSAETTGDSFVLDSIDKKVRKGIQLLKMDTDWLVSWSEKLSENRGKLSSQMTEILKKLSNLYVDMYYGKTPYGLEKMADSARDALVRISAMDAQINESPDKKSCENCESGYYCYNQKAGCGEISCYLHPESNGDFKVWIPEDEFTETAEKCKHYSPAKEEKSN